ncbi:BREX-4 system phosphatase PglZ [Sporomusa paucivorans]|uniref:BREX-4 system phosphatase PglZ n=1 Tax=Sporomusa paucivorans TaxID=2376 RepID=UPI003570D272
MTAITTYLKSNVNTPFFAVVGDIDYANIKSKLSLAGLDVIRLSEYCSADDKRPNLDNLYEQLQTLDVNFNGKQVVVLGVGEYLALCGDSVANNTLTELKDLRIGTAKAVLLLRGVTNIVRDIQRDDAHRFDNRRVHYADNTDTSISVSFVGTDVALTAPSGLQTLLQEFENGATGNLTVKSGMAFPKAIIPTYSINSAYDGVKIKAPLLQLSQQALTDSQWGELLSNIELLSQKQDISLIKYDDWRCFIRLKVNGTDNGYLKYVLDRTDIFDYFKHNVLNTIIDIPHTDSRFNIFYDERKALIKKFSESDLAEFVKENQRNTNDALYKLTDQKAVERRELVSLFSILDKDKVSARIQEAYPSLHDYLNLYTFTDPKVSVDFRKLLTEYFDSYKWQKVCNIIDDDFVTMVERLALERPYGSLDTRQNVIKSIGETETLLFWLDALGVEYLALIQALCRKQGLTLRVHIARAELPTITTQNNDFYYKEWRGDKAPKDERLDDIKHGEASKNYKPLDMPIYLADEITIIEDIIEQAKTQLALYNYKKILLVSDHGASRLAVIKKQDEKYNADTQGEHSGRCCKEFPDYDLPFASVENGFIVLANYGRFKGSRAANVEVHGGASLEEVIVPIIELTLANPDTRIELDKSKVIYANPINHEWAKVVLFSKTKLSNVILSVIETKRQYSGVQIDNTHYVIQTDIRRKGNYHADVFDGDNLIGKIEFTVQSKSGGGTGFDDELEI